MYGRPKRQTNISKNKTFGTNIELISEQKSRMPTGAKRKRRPSIVDESSDSDTNDDSESVFDSEDIDEPRKKKSKTSKTPEVEGILDHRVDDEGKVWLEVQWVDSYESSWAPAKEVDHLYPHLTAAYFPEIENDLITALLC